MVMVVVVVVVVVMVMVVVVPTGGVHGTERGASLCFIRRLPLPQGTTLRVQPTRWMRARVVLDVPQGSDPVWSDLH